MSAKVAASSRPRNTRSTKSWIELSASTMREISVSASIATSIRKKPNRSLASKKVLILLLITIGRVVR